MEAQPPAVFGKHRRTKHPQAEPGYELQQKKFRERTGAFVCDMQDRVFGCFEKRCLSSLLSSLPRGDFPWTNEQPYANVRVSPISNSILFLLLRKTVTGFLVKVFPFTLHNLSSIQNFPVLQFYLLVGITNKTHRMDNDDRQHVSIH